MNNFVKNIIVRRKKSIQEDEKFWQDTRNTFIILIQLLFIATLKFAEKAITTVSYIFPFSYILKSNRFHYSNKPFMDAWSELIEINKKSKTNFYIKSAYEDQYFYNYIGKFEGEHTKKNIDNYLEMVKGKFKNNVFMQNYGRGLKKIQVIREAVAS